MASGISGNIGLKGHLSGNIGLKGHLSGGVSAATTGTDDYTKLKNKPKINETTVEGEKLGKDYSLQDLLIAGGGIEITDNGDHTATITATADYEQLINKPILNGVTIQGTKESQDYKLTLSVQDIEKILYLD